MTAAEDVEIQLSAWQREAPENRLERALEKLSETMLALKAESGRFCARQGAGRVT